MILLLSLGCIGSWTMLVSVENTSAPGALSTSDGATHDIKLAPGLVVVHDRDFSLFTVGEAASEGLEDLAEDGDSTVLEAALLEDERVLWFEVIHTIDGDNYADAPLFPGDRIETEAPVSSGDRISFAQMFGESNDVFIGTPEPLVVRRGLEGDMADALVLLDAGTEVNQEPGLGADQAPRQSAPGVGEAEGGVISEVGDADAGGWRYPALDTFVLVELERVDPE